MMHSKIGMVDFAGTALDAILTPFRISEFPALPKIEKRDALVLSQFSLKEIIRQTVFSISDNESNKIMTGELFEISGTEFKAEWFRLSLFRCQVPYRL